MKKITELRIDLREPVEPGVTSAPEVKIREHWASGCDSISYRRGEFTQRLICEDCDERL